MKVDRNKIVSNLPKKGFVKDDTHHIYFHHHYNGDTTGIHTYVSHSKKVEYSGNLLAQVRKQLRLDSNKDVLDLVNCPMDEDQYNNILK